LAELLEKIALLGDALCNIVQHSKLAFLCGHRAVPLPKPVKVFNNTIVCFELNRLSVDRGDYLLSANDKGEYRVGEILEIRAGSRSCPELKIEWLGFRIGSYHRENTS
jgi:hypothetical protein